MHKTTNHYVMLQFMEKHNHLSNPLLTIIFQFCQIFYSHVTHDYNRI